MAKALGVVLCAAGLATQALAADVTGEFNALRALQAERPPSGGLGTLQEIYERNQRLHREALKFMETHPDHPLRWDALVMLRFATGFQKVVEEDGRKKIVRDVETEREWHPRYQALLAELLAAPDASDEARRLALGYLIRQHAYRITRRLTPDPAGELTSLRLRFAEMERRFPQTLDYVSACRDYVQTLDAVDPAECVAFLARLQAEHRTNRFPDAQLREIAESHQRVLQEQARPLAAEFTSLDGRAVTTVSRRGRVLLIAFCPLSDEWTLRFRELTKSLGPRGLDIVQVVARENLGERTKAAALARLRDAARDLPWTVAYQPGTSTRDDLLRRLGINEFPAFVLLARDGGLAGTPGTLTPGQLERRIREEIELPSPPTPK